METGEDCNTRYYALNSLLEIWQGACPIQAYIDKFLKLKTLTQLKDKLTAMIFQKGVNLAMKDLLKHYLPTLSLENLVPLCKDLMVSEARHRHTTENPNYDREDYVTTLRPWKNDLY
ncbi:hypothetical protein DSO57_1025173 [Entomophthora muscae]|uniref:Uncharacterized protein n=1 Tax=Entomophthora muscae TaxID=34485 RepID=A0ACC2U093_9FUNG|nr:hypothetical protein DSO57_1025173 [Entomophthora muscae]